MAEHQYAQQPKKTDTTVKKQTTPKMQLPSSHPTAIIQRARINPKSLTHADVMQLQRTIGNRAVGKLLTEIGLIPSETKQAQPVQMQTIPEEEKEPLQGKMVETIQRQEIPEEEEPIQTKKENNTGIPDNLRTGVENLSGIDMSDVRVHYNSSKPAEVGALAYTQGTNIHVAPGQEKHLPHETWHVVQQTQGRVQPTMQMKEGVQVNDDVGLEREADEMGKLAGNKIEEQNKIVFRSSAISEENQPRAKACIVTQLEYDFNGQRYDVPTEVKDGKGETANNQVEATYDSNLPTPYGVLKHHFKEKLNEDAFVSKKNYSIGENFDRPHRISAKIKSGPVEERKDPSYVSGVGALGNEELKIRQQNNNEMKFAGGHLIGADILGKGSMAMYNLAPQEARNNSVGYNDTIERALRKSDDGCEYDYTITLAYDNLNYEVDQGQLKAHGIISEVDEKEPWVIQLPTRIPKDWTAEAKKISSDKFFGTSPLDDKSGIRFDQYSQDMESPLDSGNPTSRARYNIDAAKLDDTKADDTKDATKITFKMHQWTPADMDRMDRPEKFTLDKTKYASIAYQEETTTQLNERVEYLKKYKDEIESGLPSDFDKKSLEWENEGKLLEIIKAELNDEEREDFIKDYTERAVESYSQYRSNVESYTRIRDEAEKLKDKYIPNIEPLLKEIEVKIKALEKAGGGDDAERKKIKNELFEINKNLSILKNDIKKLHDIGDEIDKNKQTVDNDVKIIVDRVKNIAASTVRRRKKGSVAKKGSGE